MKNILIALFICIAINTSAQNDTSTNKILHIKLNGVVIEGTLLLPPSTNSKTPLAIIIAGSGPTDRNGNSTLGITPASYQLLAEELAKEGIASFRYDKRGIAKSAVANMDESKLSFGDYINDAVSIFDYIKDSAGFSKIYFLGHSEGSLIGMVAAQKRNIAGYVSISGAGRNIDEVITEQVTKQSPQSEKATIKIFKQLKMGKTVDTIPQGFESLFRHSIQPYFISWLKHDPANEIKQVTAPTLILQGTCDIQVSQEDAELLHAANPKAKLDIIPHMTHTLKDADADCNDEYMKTYHDKTLPIDAKLIEDIVSFIKG
jgi:pimeloyl-ACP methyl ester carboxylesterase